LSEHGSEQGRAQILVISFASPFLQKLQEVKDRAAAEKKELEDTLRTATRKTQLLEDGYQGEMHRLLVELEQQKGRTASLETQLAEATSKHPHLFLMHLHFIVQGP
jgi:hypothetical protein